MTRLLLVTPTELTRDPRARRAAAAARDRAFEVVGLCGQITGEDPIPLDGVEVARVGRKGRSSSLWQNGRAPARGLALLRELRGVYRLLRLGSRTVLLWRSGRALGRFDVVHANDLDTLPAGWLLARRSHARLVYDAHELYSAFEADPPRLYRAVSTELEAALARRAHSVATVSDAIAEELQHRFQLRRRPLVVLNAPRRTSVEFRTFEEGPLRAIYQGGLGPGRRLDDLLQAAEAPGVALTLRLVLADVEAVRATVAERGLRDRVELAAPVSPDQAVEALSDFEAGIIFDRPYSRNSELSFPNKLFEYLMAGLAVVAPALPTLGPFVEREGVGITFDPDQASGLPAALARLAADRTRLLETRRRARSVALERFNAEAAAAVLAEAWNATPAETSNQADSGGGVPLSLSDESAEN